MSTQSAESAFSHTKQGAVLYALSTYRVFQVTGSDAVRYLHGRLTCDVKALLPSHAHPALMLNAQGRVQGTLLLVRNETGFTVLSGPLGSEDSIIAFRDALLQFKVSDDVILAEEKAARVFLLAGIKSSKFISKVAGGETVEPLRAAKVKLSGDSLTVVHYPIGKTDSYFVVTSSDLDLLNALDAVDPTSSLVLSDGVGFELLRISEVLPLYPDDFPQKVVAPDVDVSHFASFQKGCYVGQEVVEMATARGRPARRFVAFSATGHLERGEIHSPAGDIAGFITSSAYMPSTDQSFALGFLKSSVDDSSQLFVGQIEITRRV